MTDLSVIIPSRNERFLPQTIDDLFKKAAGSIEVIAILDGYWPNPMIPDRPGLIFIHRTTPRGMRDGINSAAAIARGKFLMKCDAHCMFGEGFDEILKADIEDNWIVVPRRYSLDCDKWERADKEPIDAMHYFWPYAHPDDLGLHGRPWMQRSRDRKDILVDEDVTFQGSMWFMHRDHFHKRLGGMSEIGWETFMGEPQEIGFKTQLGPWEGKIMRNKKTWYAHLHKGHTGWKSKPEEGGRIASSERSRCNAYSFDFWWNNRWEGRAHDLDWLIDHFWPHPGWPQNWRDYRDKQPS